MDTLQQVLKDGGEGVVLRQPGSVYIHGRSDSLFKLKVMSTSLFFVSLSLSLPLLRLLLFYLLLMADRLREGIKKR